MRPDEQKVESANIRWPVHCTGRHPVPFLQMFGLIRPLFQSLVSGPNDLPAGEGKFGGAVGSGDDWVIWGDYTAVGRGTRGELCAPEKDDDNDC
jgi:hypothetical protein